MGSNQRNISSKTLASDKISRCCVCFMQNLRGWETTEKITWKTQGKAEVFDMEISKPSKVWHPAAVATKYAQVAETPAGSIPLMTSTWRVQCKCKPAEIAVSLNLIAWSFGDFQGNHEALYTATIWLGSKNVELGKWSNKRSKNWLTRFLWLQSPWSVLWPNRKRMCTCTTAFELKLLKDH